MKIIMAPLRGVTTATYRRVYKSLFDGIDIAMAPFISTTQGCKVSDRLVKDILPENNVNSYDMIPQLIGKNPDDLPPYIEKFIELGCTEVNWNLGCPAPMVTKKMRGSGLLPHPDRIDAYTKRLNEFDLPYSVKVRAGLVSEEEILTLLPIFEKNSCKEITVHPRTAAQGYTGRANITLFGRITEQTSLPLNYNGDIATKEMFQDIVDQFGDRVSGLMLGRGILINPFLAEEIRGIARPSDPSERIREFMIRLYEEYCEELSGIIPVLGRMKELWQYLELSYPEGKQAIKKIRKCTSDAAYKKNVDKLFLTPFLPPESYVEQ